MTNKQMARIFNICTVVNICIYMCVFFFKHKSVPLPAIWPYSFSYTFTKVTFNLKIPITLNMSKTIPLSKTKTVFSHQPLQLCFSCFLFSCYHLRQPLLMPLLQVLVHLTLTFVSFFWPSSSAFLNSGCDLTGSSQVGRICFNGPKRSGWSWSNVTNHPEQKNTLSK